MYRCDAPNNVALKPAKLAAVNAAGFYNNMPGAGPGTVVLADQLNTIQEEIAGVIEGASIPLDRENDGQLKLAIQALVAGVLPTGFRGATTDAVAPGGWIKASGLTIGNAGSNATERANPDTLALFTMYWNNRPDLQLYTSAGAAVPRGGSVASDWASGHAIATPDYNGRVGVGKDNMAGAAKNRVTTGVGGVDGTVIGAAGGNQNVTIQIGNLPSAGRYDWAHGNDTPSSGGGNVHGVDRDGLIVGQDVPLKTLPPMIVELIIIKL